jgi:hypothetical protein
MRVEGSLEGAALGAVLRRIGDDRATGILTLQGEEDIIGVTFVGGEIVSVDAVNQPPEETTGRLLVERGLLTREALATLLGEQEAGGPRMQESVVEQGLVDPEELSEVQREKSLRLCSRALAWRRGRYRFYPNDEVAYEPGMTAITVTEVLALEALGAPSPPTPRTGDALPPLAPPPERTDAAGAGAREPGRAESSSWLDRVGRDLESVGTPARLAWTLALVAALALALAVWRLPARVYFPITAERLAELAYGRQQRSAFYLKVDRAAKAYYLLTGSFPDSLPELVAPGLLAEADLRASRREVAYAEAPVSYLVLVGDEAGPAGSHRTETVAGHFLLDPAFVSPEVVEAPPLVLLD